MFQTKLLYSGRITRVRFSLCGTDDIKDDSYVTVNSHELFRNGKPYPGGLYDPHTGTTDHNQPCETCYNKKPLCIGHEGNIILNYPVWNPLGVVDGRKWIKLICHNCAKPIIPEAQFIRFPRAKRLDEASKIARTQNRQCVHCKTVHPTIKKDAKEPLLMIAELVDDEKHVTKTKIYPHNAWVILNKISDETVILLGKNPLSHPKNFILGRIKVPSVTIRPDIKKMGGGRSTNDDLTTLLQVIIKKNDVLPAVLPKEMTDKIEKNIFELNNTFYDYVKASGENSVNSLASRLKGKQGRFRKNQMGKRARNMCRSTITGDPTIRIDEVGVPLEFARTIQYEEVVQEFNKARLLVYVQNGKKKYPGATKIIKKNSGSEFDIDPSREIELENGDIILRDMIDGDPVNFNRQPSLALSNISCHRAIVTRDVRIKTLRMNVLATPLYNADFDGDQMNLIISSGIAARNEIAELASVSNWLISHTTSSPSMGQVDDSIVGTAELTRTGVVLNKYHAMLLFQNSSYLPSFNDVGEKGITGRACFSKILENTPINFKRTPQWYNPLMAPYISYDPDDIQVVIDQGVLKKGVLDKKSIGKGSNGGIYHIIANEYSYASALEVMFNTQQLAIAFMLHQGFTIGIMDMMLSTTAKKKVDQIASDIINKSRLITARLNNGEIIPPIGKTVAEFFEEQQINTLSIFDDFNGPIMQDINPETNNLFKLIMYGSKGKMEHLYNMVSSVGQKLINGERIRQTFGFKRTLAYYPRFDTSPEARGYIQNSYSSGMTSSEYIFNAMAARFDLISKALSTSVTGEQERKSIKNLESLIVNNFRWVVKDKNIVQLSYGEDFLDPQRVERVKFPTALITDSAFEAYSNKAFPAEFEAMQHDRVKYRKMFLQLECMSVKELMSDERKLPVNVERLVSDILRVHQDSLATPSSEDLAEMVKMVNSLCDNIPYVLINEIQEKRQTAIPDYIREATWLLVMLIRSYLHPNALRDRKIIKPVLGVIISKIRFRYSRALIEPGTAAGIIGAQSFSEPLTQYMLDAHHRSVSGGTSNSGMTSAKEILGARAVVKLSAPTMLIPVLPEYETDKAKVQEIANNIEVMKFTQFVTSWQIFFESFGEPQHTKYVDEKSIITEFVKNNPLVPPPGNLIKWCIRFALNKTTLILKNMSLEVIITKLREKFPDAYMVYSSENSTQVIIRVYILNSRFKGAVTVNDISSLKELLLDTIIRGVAGIINTFVIKLIRNKTNLDGSISRNDNIWGITTRGTNLAGILTNRFVDRYKVHTSAIQEMYDIFGIETAQQSVNFGLKGLVDNINHRHYITYSAEMSYTGRITSIESGGLKTRESSNVLLRIGFVSPMSTIEEAAINSMEDSVTGITAPLLVGSVPRHGTLYNSFSINADFVRKNVRKPDDIIEESLF
jgi:DNA-directed RNA polymerase beta' subunit